MFTVSQRGGGTTVTTQALASRLRRIPGYPRPGVTFIDITPVLQDGAAERGAIEALEREAAPLAFDLVVAPEARGFLFGAPLAVRRGVGFAPVRKAGKLPSATVSAPYALEYGEDRVEMHRDALRPGERVLVVDDLLATGGTVGAGIDLVEALGGRVAAALFLVELVELGGRAGRLKDYRVLSVVRTTETDAAAL
jgi:adenine phosphoribosyltransferase